MCSLNKTEISLSLLTKKKWKSRNKHHFKRYWSGYWIFFLDGALWILINYSLWTFEKEKKNQFLFIFEINMQIRWDPVSNHNMNVVIEDSNRNKPYHHKQRLCLVHGECSLMLGKWTQMYNTLFRQQFSGGEKQERGFMLRNSERKRTWRLSDAEDRKSLLPSLQSAQLSVKEMSTPSRQEF